MTTLPIAGPLLLRGYKTNSCPSTTLNEGTHLHKAKIRLPQLLLPQATWVLSSVYFNENTEP